MGITRRDLLIAGAAVTVTTSIAVAVIAFDWPDAARANDGNELIADMNEVDPGRNVGDYRVFADDRPASRDVSHAPDAPK